MRKGILSVISALTLSLTILSASRVNAATLDKRLAGSDRYETGAKIVSEGWTTSDYAVVASGEGFADALCAAPLAKKYNAPILLTEKNTLNTETKNQLIRIKAKNVFIVGGIGVVSDNIKNQLESMGISATRLSGEDRFETSLEVARNLGDSNGVVVTNGYGFADALSIAPIAAQRGMSILLTDKDDLPSATKEFLAKKSYSENYILGGTGVVSTKINSYLNNPVRLGGLSRYETNAAVLNYFADKFSYNKVYVASGENYPDALSGSALAALNNSPIILVGGSVDPSVMSSIKAQHDKYNNVMILGGTAVVSDIVAHTIVRGFATTDLTTIKNEFKKMGFVFSSDKAALYDKDGISIGLVDAGEYWQLAVKTWGEEEEGLFYRGMSIILGQDAAWSSLIYIDYALEMPNSVHTTPYVRTFVSDNKLVVHIFK
jgi:putative cell wall-binding protein